MDEKKTKEEQSLEKMKKFVRDNNLDVQVGLIPDEKLPKGRVRYTFFGEVKLVPVPGEAGEDERKR